jgi:hypothetical protein
MKTSFDSAIVTKMNEEDICLTSKSNSSSTINVVIKNSYKLQKYYVFDTIEYSIDPDTKQPIQILRLYFLFKPNYFKVSHSFIYPASFTTNLVIKEGQYAKFMVKVYITDGINLKEFLVDPENSDT